MSAKRTLMDEVLAEMAEAARTGSARTDITCGKCNRTEGVRTYTQEIELEPAGPGRKRVIDYHWSTICPCCSFDSCPHEYPYHGEVRFKQGRVIA